LKGINPEVSDLEVDKLGENELFLKYLFLGWFVLEKLLDGL
jgi:hypothetical protein